MNSKKSRLKVFLCPGSNVIALKEKEKLEHPEKNLPEKRRLNPAQQTQPYYGVEAGTRTQATLLYVELVQPLPPRHFMYSLQ